MRQHIFREKIKLGSATGSIVSENARPENLAGNGDNENGARKDASNECINIELMLQTDIMRIAEKFVTWKCLTFPTNIVDI